MFKNIISVIILIFIVACANDSFDKELDHKIIPDNTPYIAGLIEATDDTVHHFPEVVVGYFTDPMNNLHPDIIEEYEDYDYISNPDLIAQVAKLSQAFRLTFSPENNAEVIVQGPKNHEEEKKVALALVKQGLYQDINQDLVLIPNGTYTISVNMPNGAIYQSTTQIPEEVQISVPDTMSIDVHNTEYGDGTPYEIHTKRGEIVIKYPLNTHVLILQSNANTDRQTLLLNPDEDFLFADRGNYLRSGSLYYIGMGKNGEDTLWRSWIQDLHKPKNEIWNSKRVWMRFSFFDKGIGGNFFPMEDIFTAQEEWEEVMSNPFYKAFDMRDSTYLFNISTMLKVNENGEVLPKEKSDAIGFFGGYYSVYKKMIVLPKRNFDVDSLRATYGYN